MGTVESETSQPRLRVSPMFVAPWKILVNDTTMFKEVYFDFPEEEFRRMLANSNVILPGEPGFIPPVQA